MESIFFRDVIEGDKSFLGKFSQDLGNLIGSQMEAVFEAEKIVIPVKSCSIILMLGFYKEASLVELALSLEQSHQLVKQKIPKLISLGLIDQKNDPNDGRRKIFFLTPKGNRQLKKFEEFRSIARKLVEGLSKEINADVFSIVSRTVKSLREKDMIQRYKEL